jgi:deoxyribodipyrimidine photolyase
MAAPYPQGEQMKTASILFNRDPRVHDNPALATAAFRSHRGA